MKASRMFLSRMLTVFLVLGSNRIIQMKNTTFQTHCYHINSPDRTRLEEGKACLHEENEKRNNNQEKLIILFSEQLEFLLNSEIGVGTLITLEYERFREAHFVFTGQASTRTRDEEHYTGPTGCDLSNTGLA